MDVQAVDGDDLFILLLEAERMISSNLRQVGETTVGARFSDPDSGSLQAPGARIDGVIPGIVYEHAFKTEPIKYWNLIPAKQVLETPLLIFEGVRQFNEGGWCYVGRPTEYYLREQVTVSPLEPERVFTVYLNPRMMVYEWRLESADRSGIAFPKDHFTRYDRLAWRHTS